MKANKDHTSANGQESCTYIALTITSLLTQLFDILQQYCVTHYTAANIITLKCIRTLIYLIAGDDFTVEQMCEMFKEAKVEEPNWLEVSSKLRLILYDRVSSSELYQVWSKHGPSWNKLIQALEKLDGYQQVVQQAKKKAGECDTWHFISIH